jgi:hypothetical protein
MSYFSEYNKKRCVRYYPHPVIKEFVEALSFVNKQSKSEITEQFVSAAIKSMSEAERAQILRRYESRHLDGDK